MMQQQQQQKQQQTLQGRVHTKMTIQDSVRVQYFNCATPAYHCSTLQLTRDCYLSVPSGCSAHGRDEQNMHSLLLSSSTMLQ